MMKKVILIIIIGLFLFGSCNLDPIEKLVAEIEARVEATKDESG